MVEKCQDCNEKRSNCKCAAPSTNGASEKPEIPPKVSPPIVRQCSRCHNEEHAPYAWFCNRCGGPLNSDHMSLQPDTNKQISQLSASETNKSCTSNDNLTDSIQQKTNGESQMNKIFGASKDLADLKPMPVSEQNGKMPYVDDVEAEMRMEKLRSSVENDVKNTAGESSIDRTSSGNNNDDKTSAVDDKSKTPASFESTKSKKTDDTDVHVLKHPLENRSPLITPEKRRDETVERLGQKTGEKTGTPVPSYANVAGKKPESATTSKNYANSQNVNLVRKSQEHNRFGDRQCRTVHFAVLVSPDFNYNPKYHDIFIMFGHSGLGGFGDVSDERRMEFVSFFSEYAVMALNLQIPFDITWTDYKYMMIEKENFDKYQWECLHHSYDHYANRRLHLNNKPDEIFYRFDNCLEPKNLRGEKAKSILERVTSLFTSSSPSPIFEKVYADTATALECFWPKWSPDKGFYFPYDCDDLSRRGTVVLSVEAVLRRIDTLLLNFASLFYVDYNSRDTQAVWNCASRWIEKRLQNSTEIPFGKLNPAKRVELGFVLLHLACAVSSHQHVEIPKNTLIKICNLFACDNDKANADSQRAVILENSTDDRKKELTWLIAKLVGVPQSVIVLPLYHILMNDEWWKNTSDVIDRRWWVMYDRQVFKSDLKDFDWTELSAVLSQYEHYPEIDPHFVPYILAMFCFDAEDVKKVLNVCSPHLILAWCTYRANADSYYVRGEKCSSLISLLQTVHEKVSKSNKLTQILPKCLMMLEKFLGVLTRTRSYGRLDNAKFLLKVTELADLFVASWNHTVETTTIFDCSNLLAELKQLLSLNGDCFKIKNYYSGDEKWKTFYELLLWKGNSSAVMDAWAEVIRGSLKAFPKDDVECMKNMIKFFCSESFVNLDERVKKIVEELMEDFIKTILRKKDTSLMLTKWLDEIQEGSSSRFSTLLSFFFTRSWPKKDNISDFEILMHVLKFPSIIRYFDSKILFAEPCCGLINWSKKVLLTYKNLCNSHAVLISELKEISVYKDVFLGLLHLLDGGWDDIKAFSKIMENISNFMRQFSEHVDRMKILSPFISKLDLQDEREIDEFWSLNLNETRFSSICVKNDDGSLNFRWKLPEDLIGTIRILDFMKENNLFKLYWNNVCENYKNKSEQCSDMRITSNADMRITVEYSDESDDEEKSKRLSFENLVEEIFLPAVEYLQIIIDSFKDLSISIENLEEILNSLPESAVSLLPDEIRKICSEVLCCEKSWVNGFELKLNLYKDLKKCSSTNTVLFNLVTKFNFKTALNDLKQLSAFNMHEKIDLKLADIKQSLVDGAKKLKNFDQAQLDCLAAVVECWELIQWVREKDKNGQPRFNEKDLLRFVDIALTNVGESDIEIKMITDFNNVITNFSCLMFNVPDDLSLNDFFKRLERLWESLSRNPNLAKQLTHSCANRRKIEELWKASGDLEKTSLGQVENINRKGVFKIGDIDKKSSKKTVETCVQVEFADESENGTKVYTMTELRDLHSRVMLIGTQMDKDREAKKQIDEFAQKFDGILRLASLYVQHYEAGNILFTEWICFLENDSESALPAVCHLSAKSANLISVENDKSVTVLHQIESLCSFFEEALNEWNAYVENLRDEFFELNYFTNRQIEYLRQTLARVGKENGLDPKAAVILLVLNSRLTTADVEDATLTCLNSASENRGCNENTDEFDEEQVDFIDQLEGFGLERNVAVSAAVHTNFEDVPRALDWAAENSSEVAKTSTTCHILPRDSSFFDQLNEYVESLATDSQKVLACKLKSLWFDYISNKEGGNYAEFLGVHLVGQILRELAAAAPKPAISKLHGIKMNEPNLFLAPSSDLYRFVLGLYSSVGDSSCVPTFRTVLMCNETTTIETVKLFARRIKSSNGEALYSLVDVDQLKSDVCLELELILEKLMNSGKEFCLALVAGEENFQKSAASNYMCRFTTKYSNLLSWHQSKQIVYQHVQRDAAQTVPNLTKIPPEFCLSYFKASFFTSVGYGHGKSRIISAQKRALPNASFHKVPIHEQHLSDDEFYLSLKNYLVDPSTAKPRLFHVDVLSHHTTGVDKMLFQLFILGGFTTTDGDVWRVLPDDSYAIEMTSSPNRHLSMHRNDENVADLNDFRFLLPIVLCHSPSVSFNLASNKIAPNANVVNRSFDEDWLNDQATQLCYQYLSLPKQQLEQFVYVPTKTCAAGNEVLKVLLENCGVDDPSWSELRNFVNFLSLQLKSCEASPYCDNVQELPGFKSFGVKFMIKMSRDFSTRSLEISEDVGTLIRDQLDVVDAYKIEEKQQWEHKAHPYLFFNEDGMTFSFFGCNLNKLGDLVDPNTQQVIEAKIATPNLVIGLYQNGVDDLRKRFDDKSRLEKINKLCMVLGVDFFHDPDLTYEITSDCALKMLAIKMRFRCGIPVVIMGETGCGKTKLIQYLCDLERNYYLQPDVEVKPQTLIIVRVHGGTTKENIETEVVKAVEVAKSNYEQYELGTVLFFDEANATPAISLIKEIMCDGTMNGRKLNLKENHLNVIAAVNPYRKHSEEMIKKLESSGLGYHVNVSKVTEKFGNVPLRQLVYRVHPLPASMLPMVWDFGTLTNQTEGLYIRQMVQRFVSNSNCKFPDDKGTVEVFSKILIFAQKWMREQKDEASFVSLRNVERALTIVEWFYNNRKLFFENSPYSPTTLSILIAICVGYRCSIQKGRKEFDDEAIKCFVNPLDLPKNSEGILAGILKKCQETFLENVDLPGNIAKNEALRENVFMMVLCIELRIPLFLVGKPGSSKSLAKTVVAENMLALSSKSILYHSLKQAALVSFQCSPLATADGVETIFRQCARQQQGQNLLHYVAAAVFDEIGLAEDSPALPLKALHGLLENGVAVNKEELTDYHRVAFVGISNWALDPAKMNRGIFVTRIDPSRKQLFDTAKRICHEDERNSAFQLVANLIHPVIEAYLEVCEKQEKSFYGLRDFYSLIKKLYEIAEAHARPPNYREVVNAVRHNFSGQKNCMAIKTFESKLALKFVVTDDDLPSVTEMIQENLGGKRSLNRYLLLLSENYAAMSVIKKVKALDGAEIIFGSSFPQDLEYTQVCRNINKIKVCMDKGRTVVLLNLEQLYESLYDLLNQAFIQCSGEYFVDLGLGTHRLKCHVHKNFRLVVVAECEDALNRFPLALLNRLEKHLISTIEEIQPNQKNIIEDLKNWAEKFAECRTNGSASRQLVPADVFIGYHNDTPTAIVGEISAKNEPGENILESAKNFLLQSATPDGVLRMRYTQLRNDEDELSRIYFKQQSHASFFQYIEKNSSFVKLNNLWQSFATENIDGASFSEYLPMKSIATEIKCLNQITTHSQLFSQNDSSKLAKNLKLDADQLTIVTLQIYNTEHEFQKRIRQIFQSALEKPQILIVQCLAGDRNAKLIACCRYILENAMKSEEFIDSKIHVFFLVSLPRIAGGCFKGFPSINWKCYHIDELSPHVNEIDDLTCLIDKSVSSLLEDFIKNKNSKSVNFDFIIKESLQVAASFILDETPRKLERLELLQYLWNENEIFRGYVRWWLQKLLAEQEENWANAKNWIFNEAAKTGSLLEHRTFKQALCKFVENLIVPLLSGMISVVDAGHNLSLLRKDGWISNLWLQLFSDDNFLHLRYNSNVFLKNDKIAPRHEFNVLTEIKFAVRVPFFWIIKSKIDEIVNELERSGNSSWNQFEERGMEIIKGTSWGSILCHSQLNFAQFYVRDFILATYNVKEDTKLSNLLMMWLAHAAKLDEKQKISPVLSVSIVHRRLIGNFKSFLDVVEIEPRVVEILMKNTGEFSKFFYALDLLSVDKLLKIMNEYMDDIEPKKTIMLTKNQKANRSNFVLAVKSASSIVKLIFSKYGCENNESPLVKDLLTRLKKEWFAAELCSSFLYHAEEIKFPLKVTGLWKKFVDTKEIIDGLNCVKFWKDLETFMKVWTTQLFAHYFKSPKLICVVCKKSVFQPHLLPCMHVTHQKCFDKIIELKVAACLDQECLKPFSKDDEKLADEKLKSNCEQYAVDRRSLMNFFLDAVCELFNGDEEVSLDILKLLLSYVTHETENQISTSEILPFPDEDAIDTSPIIRSFLLQLILNQNFAFVLEQIDAYLDDCRRYLNSDAKLTDFLWMCICCTEDSFNGKFVKHCGLNNNEFAAINFVLQNIPKAFSRKNVNQFSSRELEQIARTRFVLSTFVEIVGKFEKLSKYDRFATLSRFVKQFLDELEDKNVKLFLVKQICLRYGIEFARKLSTDELCRWIVDCVPLGNDTPDLFVIYGDSYVTIKDAVFETVFHDDQNIFDEKLKTTIAGADKDLVDYFICCAVQQWVKSMNVEKFSDEQSRIFNLIGGKMFSAGVKPIYDRIINENYWKTLVESSNSSSLACFAFNLCLALFQLPSSGVITFFKTILTNPDQLNGVLFPGMPEHDFDQNMFNLLKQTVGPSVNECPNGHPYVIGDCGRPATVGLCVECKAQIGGQSYNYVAGNKLLTVAEDKTRRGHCLGDRTQLGDNILPIRDLDRLSVAVCRLLVHCSMWMSSLDNPNAVASLVVPEVAVDQITGFCLNHVKHDLDLLSKLLSVSAESVITLIHKLIDVWLTKKGGCQGVHDLTTKNGRRNWEKIFVEEILSPVLADAATVIADCNALIAKNGTKNQFYSQIYENPKTDYWLLFWSYRLPNSYESLLMKVLSELDGQKDRRLLILAEFLKRTRRLSAVQYLPAIINLHSEMRRQFGGIVNLNEIRKTTIKQFLANQPDSKTPGDIKKLEQLIESYFSALRIVEPRLNNLAFTLKSKEKTNDGVKTVTRRISIEKRMIPNLSDPMSNSVMSVIPVAFGEGFCSCAVVDLLINEQNDFVAFCAKISGTTDDTAYKQLDENLTNSVMNFDADRDIYPLLILRQNFSFDLTMKTESFFDLTRLQRQLERFYVKDNVLLQYYVPLVKSRESILYDCLTRLRAHENKIGVKAEEIMNALAGRPDQTRALLDFVEPLIRFCVSGDHSDEKVVDFAQKIGRLPPSDPCLSKVITGISVGQLPSLWQAVVFQSKFFLLTSKEDPFPEVSDQCKVALSGEEKKILEGCLRNRDLIQFLLETTEFLLLHLSFGASGIERLRYLNDNDDAAVDVYEEELETYLLDRDECKLKMELNSNLKLKHSVDVWKYGAKKFAMTRKIL